MTRFQNTSGVIQIVYLPSRGRRFDDDLKVKPDAILETSDEADLNYFRVLCRAQGKPFTELT